MAGEAIVGAHEKLKDSKTKQVALLSKQDCHKIVGWQAHFDNKHVCVLVQFRPMKVKNKIAIQWPDLNEPTNSF